MEAIRAVHTQVLPALRLGQLVSIVRVGEMKLYDMGRVTRIREKGEVIDAAVDGRKGDVVSFRFYPEEGVWYWFEDTSHGQWRPGRALDPDAYPKYLIEGIN